MTQEPRRRTKMLSDRSVLKFCRGIILTESTKGKEERFREARWFGKAEGREG